MVTGCKWTRWSVTTLRVLARALFRIIIVLYDNIGKSQAVLVFVCHLPSQLLFVFGRGVTYPCDVNKLL